MHCKALMLEKVFNNIYPKMHYWKSCSTIVALKCIPQKAFL